MVVVVVGGWVVRRQSCGGDEESLTAQLPPTARPQASSGGSPLLEAPCKGGGGSSPTWRGYHDLKDVIEFRKMMDLPSSETSSEEWESEESHQRLASAPSWPCITEELPAFCAI